MVIDIEKCSLAGEGAFVEDEPGYTGEGTGSNGGDDDGNGGDDDDDGGDPGGDPPQCPDEITCAEDEICQAGECHPNPDWCHSSDDCPGLNYECVDGDCIEIPDFCNIDMPCPEGFECINFRCVVDPDYCANNDQCGEGFICDTIEHECVVDPDWCWEDGDCGNNFYCDFNDPAGHRCKEYPNEAPNITLLGAVEASLSLGWGYEEPGYEAFDDRDGDITNEVLVTGHVDHFNVGTYQLDYNVTDFDGLAAITRTRLVHVIDPGDSDPVVPNVQPPPGDDFIVCDVANHTPENQPVNDGPWSINLYPIQIANSITQFAFVDSNDNPISESEGVFTGQLLGEAGAPTGFSAKLIGLDDGGPDGDTFAVIIQTFFPADEAADYWYRSNTGVLNSLTVTFNLEILYSLDFIDDGDNVFEEWHRDYLTLEVPVHIVPRDVPDPQPPYLDYGFHNLRILYNATAENEAPSQHSCSPFGWTFGNYELNDVTFELPPDLPVAGYTNSNVTMPDWSTGIIFAQSFPGDTLPEVDQNGDPLGPLRVTAEYSPALPYLGEDITLTADIPLEVVKFEDADETPPVVTLNGEPTITLYQHPWLPELTEEYIELGATGWDDRDGDVTASLVINGSVNMDQVGVYPIAYVVFDSAGNASETAFRNVTVALFPNACDPSIEICLPGHLCVDGFCEVADNACVFNEDCGEDEICDDNGFCVLDPDAGGCTNNNDCEQGWMCEVRTGDCIVDPNYCDETTDNCIEGMECDLVTNTCINTPGYLPPPVFEYAPTETAKVQYESIGFGGAGAISQAEFLMPTTWEENGNFLVFGPIEYLNFDQEFVVFTGGANAIYPDPLGPGCTTPPPPQCPQSYDIVFQDWPVGSPQHQLDLRGSIRFEPFRVVFGTFGAPPENTQFHAIVHWHTENPDNYPYYEGTIDITHDVEWIHITSLAMTGGGGGKGSKKLVGPKGGPPIVVPKALSPVPVRPLIKKSPHGKKLISRSFSYRTSPKPLSDKVITNKRRRFNYANGITDSRFSYFQNNTITPSILVGYNQQYDNSVTGISETTRPSVLGSRIDETIAGILNVNLGAIPLSDYYYNAITPQKVKNSFSEYTNKLLHQMYNLDGTPMRDSLAIYIRQAIISNELGLFTERDIEELRSESLDATGLVKSVDQSSDNRRALRLVLKNLQSINPEDFNIKKKNRMIYWKPLAEDLDKRLVFETADGTSTNIYIPNNEKIPIEYSEGKTGTLEMQDGDFFVAETVSGDNRLSVYSEIEQAKVITPEVASQAAYLANDDFYFQLDATSLPSNLVELNVDTTSARQDYYFLALDKDSIVEQPIGLNTGDTLFTRKTYAKYNEIKGKDAIDAFVKHKAYPNLTVYLRNDDMFFNHLELSETAQLTYKDITLDNFENSLRDKILIRQLPQHILVIPSDRTSKVISQQRSKFIDFTTRRLKIRFSPNQEYKRLPKSRPSVYLSPVFTETESLNFGMDIQDNIIWREKIKFVFDEDAVTAINKYKNGTEVLPRKESPISKLLQALNNIKEVYSLTERDVITTFDLFSRMEPSDYKSLSFDVDDGYNLLSRLSLNSLVDDDVGINKSKFVKVKGVANIPLSKDPTPVEVLPTNEDAPQITTKKQQTSQTGSPVKGQIPVPIEKEVDPTP